MLVRAEVILLLMTLHALPQAWSQPPTCSDLAPTALLDCASASTERECFERNETSDDLQQVPLPSKNHRSCYRTCISDSKLPVCLVRSPTFPPDKRLVRVSGPYHSEEYSMRKVFSPRFEQFPPRTYPDSRFCKYHISCDHSDSYLSVSVDSLSLEPPRRCRPRTTTTCLDYVQLEYPTGSRCTFCGSGDLICEETGNTVRSFLTFNGQRSLQVEFQSNRIQEQCGFRMLASCVRRSFFNAPACSSPAANTPPSPDFPFPPRFGKRHVMESSEDPWARRHQRATVVVPQDVTVTYKDSTVMVGVEGFWIYKFAGVRVFQVHNEVEQHMVFYKTANGRDFPGYGFLKIGFGVIEFIQESVPSQFKPTATETDIILRLHRRIVALIEEEDLDVNGGVTTLQCLSSSITEEERMEMDRDATAYGRACNGFLRAAACAYQQMFLNRVSVDCLIGVTFPSPSSPPQPSPSSSPSPPPSSSPPSYSPSSSSPLSSVQSLLPTPLQPQI